MSRKKSFRKEPFTIQGEEIKDWNALKGKVIRIEIYNGFVMGREQFTNNVYALVPRIEPLFEELSVEEQIKRLSKDSK